LRTEDLDGQKIEIAASIQAWVDRPRQGSESSEVIKRKLSKFLEFCEDNGIDDLAEFSRKDAEKYPIWLEEKNLRPKQYVNIAKSMVENAYLINDKNLRNPFAKLSLARETPKEKTVYSLEELESIINNAPNDRYKLLWSFMAFAGLRATEASTITSDGIYNDELHFIGKGGKNAVLPIGKKLAEALQKYQASLPLKIDRCNSNKVMKSVCEKLGIRRGSNHCFRHSYSTLLAQKVPNMKVTQKLMRHADIKTTINVYTHVVTDDLKKAVDDI